MKQEYQKQNNFTCGSDCELSFALIKKDETGKTIKQFYTASSFLTTSLTSKLGCDGCSSIAELRPNCAENPLEHINNLKRIMKRLLVKMDSVKQDNSILEGFAGNGFHNATGGHIHFGIKIDRNKDLLKVLDMMSIFLMPMEYKLMARKRKVGSGYGRLSAYETKSYGFEYRTPASWLYSENNSRSILCLAYTLAYEFMNNRELCNKMIKTFNTHFLDKKSLEPQRKYEEAFKTCDIEFFQSKFNFYNYFKKNVRKMIKYNEFKPYIENLFSLSSMNKKFREKMGIRAGWKNIKITKNLFYFSNDEFMYQINSCKNNKKIKERDGNIFIFGLRSNRDVDISSNNQSLVNLIKEYVDKENLNLKVEKLEIYPFNSIGLGYKLRKENKELIVNLLKHISKTKLNLEKTDYSKEEDFEKMEAETDTEEESHDCRNCGSSCDNEFCCIDCEDEYYRNREEND